MAGMFQTLALLLAILVAVSGCASTAGISQARYAQSLKNVELGMSKADFLQVFPNAEPRGSKKYSSGTLDVLEIGVDKYSFFPTGKAIIRNPLTGIESQPRWFYFMDNQLVQYGEPDDWPDANLIVKVR